MLPVRVHTCLGLLMSFIVEGRSGSGRATLALPSSEHILYLPIASLDVDSLIFPSLHSLTS